MPPPVTVGPSGGVLRDSTNKAPSASSSGFNRDLAKSTLLQKLPSKLVGTQSTTSAKLLETLSSIKAQGGAEKDTGKAPVSGLKMTGGARRVVVAAPAAGIAPNANSAEAEKEKEILLQQITMLQAQILQLQQQQHASPTPLSSSPSGPSAEQFAALQHEKESLENACIATQEALELTRAQFQQVQNELASQKTQQLEMNAAYEKLQLEYQQQNAQFTEVCAQLKQLQDEKTQWLLQAQAADADTDAEKEDETHVENEDDDDDEVVMKNVDVAVAADVEAAPVAIEAEPEEAAIEPVAEMESVASLAKESEDASFSAVSIPSAFDSSSDGNNTTAPAPSTSAVEEAQTTELPPAVMSIFSPIKDEPLPAADAASVSAEPVSDDFAPVTAEEMEASMGQSDSFNLEAETLLPSSSHLATSSPVSTSASSTSVAPITLNDSTASLNLSMSSRTSLSPTRRDSLQMKLPASFLSPTTTDANGDAGFLSPIAKESPANNISLTLSAAAPSIAPAVATSTLTASAIKIQALFRSRMERGYLASGNEKRLASLPLTSPSTPSAATPLSKRQKRSVSPVQLATSLVLEENEKMMDLSAASTSSSQESEDIQRELSFKSDEADESMEAVPAVKPISAAAASKIRAPSSSSASASSSTSSSSSTPASVTAVPSNLPPVTVADLKRYQVEFKTLRVSLNSLDACWTIRSKSMNRIEELVRERGFNGFANCPGWKEELVVFQRGLLVQLSDLRSSILREACRLLIALAESSTKEFEEQLSCYVPQLWKSLYVTIKIISTTADETLMELMARSGSAKSIPLLLTGTSDAHAVVREKCGAYLMQIIATTPRASDLEPYLPGLTSALKACVQDSDNKARAAWRGLLSALRKPFPSQMESLQAELPAAVQKTIASEMEASKGVKRSNTHKRKK